MNKERTGILRDDITLSEWSAFVGPHDTDSYLQTAVANIGKRLPIGFIHLPESFFKTVTDAYPATELKTMAEDGQLGVSEGVAVLLLDFDKTKKAAPFHVLVLATGAAKWSADFSPKGDSIKDMEGTT
jgi:hypothetical protein